MHLLKYGKILKKLNLMMHIANKQTRISCFPKGSTKDDA